MEKKKRSTLIKNFGFAAKGLRLVIQKERSMRIHIGILLLVTLCGIYFQISSLEWIICFLCFGSVLAAETFNTAIERIVDAVSPEFNPKYGEIKDIAAGAVFIAVIFTILVGLFIFLPKFISLIFE